MQPHSVTGRGWDPTPVESNFDACADLSTILVTVQGGTGSSPMQALMFHRGTYLGAGTLQAYGFTTIDTAQSTTDTVMLRYRSGQAAPPAATASSPPSATAGTAVRCECSIHRRRLGESPLMSRRFRQFN